MAHQNLEHGQTLFARYAYPPNELGYCGPADSRPPSDLASHAEEFDGAWPYLAAIADAIDASDPLSEDVVGSYWVGGPSLEKVDPAVLLARLRSAFAGQVTGLLGQLADASGILAHHSFHVFVVYPWVRFLDRDVKTALGVLQACRIRWGRVESVTGDEVVMTSPPLILDAETLTLGTPQSERVWWRKDGLSLAPEPPEPGAIVSAHWDWICGTLADDECAALADATRTTLDLVNAHRGVLQ